MKAIEIENLDFSYKDQPVLKGVNFNVDVGDLVVITGENGSGKSTLIKIITGENLVSEIKIKILGRDLDDKIIKKIGYVPQSQGTNNITFPLTTKELVVLQAYDDFGFFKIARKKHIKKAEQLLNRLGLIDYIETPITNLSGGLRQRVMIARALMNDPEILIFDEPTAGVDEDSKLYLAKLLEKLNKEDKVTVILVTHELDWIRENLINSQVYQLKKGGLYNVGL